MQPPDTRLTDMDFPLVSSDDEIEETQDDEVDCTMTLPVQSTPDMDLLSQQELSNNEDDNISDEGYGDLELDEYRDVKVCFSKFTVCFFNFCCRKRTHLIGQNEGKVVVILKLVLVRKQQLELVDGFVDILVQLTIVLR